MWNRRQWRCVEKLSVFISVLIDGMWVWRSTFSGWFLNAVECGWDSRQMVLFFPSQMQPGKNFEILTFLQKSTARKVLFAGCYKPLRRRSWHLKQGALVKWYQTVHSDWPPVWDTVWSVSCSGNASSHPGQERFDCREDGWSECSPFTLNMQPEHSNTWIKQSLFVCWNGLVKVIFTSFSFTSSVEWAVDLSN